MSAQDGASVPAANSPPPPGDPLAAWTGPVQGAVAFCFGLGLLALGGHTIFGGRSSSPAPPRHEFRIDLNHADHAELMLLPGIGEQLANRIIEHRRQYGSFRTVDDLAKVPGIGPGILDRIRPRVLASQQAAATAMSDAAKQMLVPAASPFARKSETPVGPIDINRATAEQLDALPGIGKVLARRIVEEREKRPFEKVDDLRRVKGIGPKTLEKVRALARVGPAARSTP
jgi:competence protein ComEA